MSHQPARELFEELHELLAASLTGEIAVADELRLETLVCENAQARRMYFSYLQDTSGLRWWAGEQSEIQAATRPAFSWAGQWAILKQQLRGFLTSARFLWILLGIGATAVEVAIILFMIAPRNDSQHRGGPDIAGSAFATEDETTPDVIAPKPVARLVRALDCRWLNDAGPTVGSEVEQGSDLWLTSGHAEIEFRSGARILLQGPAWLTPDSSLGGFLHQGRVTARVPQSAKGFTISTPSGRVIDLGTEFGVHVHATGEATVHVFQGQVEAMPNAPQDRTTPSSEKILLVAGQSARMDHGIQMLEGAEVGGTTSEFTRWLPDQGRFPLFATGRGLEQGVQDSRWQIAHESQPEAFQPAVVARPNPAWLPNDHYSSQWISLADGEKPLPSGRYTYRTQFDLQQFNSETARIVGRWMADNRVLEIRLNGQAVVKDLAESGFNEFLQFTISDGFAPGQNTIEFVVENDRGGDSPSALRVEWYGMAERKMANPSEVSGPQGKDRQ